MPVKLKSFVSGQWHEGSGKTVTLLNPATEEPLAETATCGIDVSAALEYARAVGRTTVALDDVQTGIEAFQQQATTVTGSLDREKLLGMQKGKGYLLTPHLFRVDDVASALIC